MNPDIQKAISIAKIGIMSKPQTAFLANMACSLPVVINDEISTARTNGKNIEINSEFFMSRNKEERTFVLAHETLHVVYMHMLRCEHRDPSKFNTAADYVINGDLDNQKFTLIPGVLLNHAFDGLSTEEVYRKILTAPESKEEEDNPLKDDVKYTEDGDGTGSEMSEEEKEGLEEEIRNMIVSAAQSAELQDKKDSIPPSVQRMLEELLKPKINWKVLLRRFMQSLANFDYTWRKPRRRMLPLGIYMPSVYSEGLSKVTFAIDTSGSITEKQFNQFMSEVYAVMKQFSPNIIDVIQFDHQLQAHDVVKSLRDLQHIVFKGHGGTQPDVALEAFNETDSLALFVITDGYFNKPRVVVDRPVFWCVFNNKDFKPPYGKVVHLELDE